MSESRPESQSSRRSFVNWLLGTSFGATVLAALYPVIRFSIPPDIPEATSNQAVAAAKDEIKPGQFKIFRFGSKPGILIRDNDGAYHALAGTCTHLDCTVQYRADVGQIWCACHNGFYAIDGRNISGPPPRPLEEFLVKESGDDILAVRKEA